MPVPVPNCLIRIGTNVDRYNLLEWLKKISPDALILSGGNDIGLEKHRDLTEETMLEFGRDRRLPVLGICRGMQMLAVNAGVDLKRVYGHVNTVNTIQGEISGKVNSYHEFSIKYCPESFKVIAKSQDGEIEAIKHRHLPWEGWMWHPERETIINKSDIGRFKKLLEKKL